MFTSLLMMMFVVCTHGAGVRVQEEEATTSLHSFYEGITDAESTPMHQKLIRDLIKAQIREEFRKGLGIKPMDADVDGWAEQVLTGDLDVTQVANMIRSEVPKDFVTPGACQADQDCSGHGVCEFVKGGYGGMGPGWGKCRCTDPKWRGAFCEVSQCLRNCSGHGQCDKGDCECDVGWMGEDCGTRMAPGTYCIADRDCNFRGKCVKGKCMCFSGWGGDDCTQAVSQCPNDCSDHGFCVNGTCVCDEGFKGVDCSTTGDCPDPYCSGHGTCQNGVCLCRPGFTGPSCADRQLEHVLVGMERKVIVRGNPMLQLVEWTDVEDPDVSDMAERDRTLGDATLRFDVMVSSTSFLPRKIDFTKEAGGRGIVVELNPSDYQWIPHEWKTITVKITRNMYRGEMIPWEFMNRLAIFRTGATNGSPSEFISFRKIVLEKAQSTPTPPPTERSRR